MGSNKRKIIYYFIVILCFALIPSLNVSASITVGGSQVPSNSFISVNTGNRVVNFSQGDSLYDITDLPSYFLYTFCTDSNKIENFYINNNSLDDVFFYKTDFNCYFPNSTYSGGRVLYMYGNTNKSTACSVQGTNCTTGGSLTFYQPNGASYSLMSEQYSIDSISIDFNSGTIVSQNSEIISQNKEIIQQNQNTYNMQQNEHNETQEKLDSVNSSINETNDTLKDSDSSGATDSAGSFFSGFTTDTFGLTSIITAPINLIKSITSSTCSPMGVPVPFVDTTMNLPCLSSIYRSYFGSFLDIYQTITFGIVGYWVCVRIFALVKDFKNPEHDEIEVLDL